MWAIEAPAPAQRMTSSAISRGVIGVAGWSFFKARAPFGATMIMTSASALGDALMARPWRQARDGLRARRAGCRRCRLSL
jgi:hypothetical protein